MRRQMVTTMYNNKIKTVKRSLRQKRLFSFFIFSITLKDQFTFLILTFGTSNFTDPGLLNMTMKDPAVPHWFAVVVLPSQVFLIY